jgi:hypothetical protein
VGTRVGLGIGVVIGFVTVNPLHGGDESIDGLAEESAQRLEDERVGGKLAERVLKTQKDRSERK